MTGYIEAIEARLHRMEGLLGGLVKDKDPRAEIVRAELDAMAREAEMTGLKLRRSKAYEEIHNVRRNIASVTYLGSFDVHCTSTAPPPMTKDLPSRLCILLIESVIGNGLNFVVVICAYVVILKWSDSNFRYRIRIGVRIESRSK